MKEKLNQYRKIITNLNNAISEYNQLQEQKQNLYAELFIEITTHPLDFLRAKPTNDLIKARIETEMEYQKVKNDWLKKRIEVETLKNIKELEQQELEFLKLQIK